MARRRKPTNWERRNAARGLAKLVPDERCSKCGDLMRMCHSRETMECTCGHLIVRMEDRREDLTDVLAGIGR